MDISKINFEKGGLNSLVGGLEADVLKCLWQGKGWKTCRQVFECVGRKNNVAYTTITVTLDRMFEKGIVERSVDKGKGGLKYNYYARFSKEELANKLSKRFVGFLKKTFGETSIAYLKKNI